MVMFWRLLLSLVGLSTYVLLLRACKIYSTLKWHKNYDANKKKAGKQFYDRSGTQ